MSSEFNSKLTVSEQTTHKLKVLKARTGLTPNISSRLALSLSLVEKSMVNPDEYPSDGMEFNRYTLLGEYDSLVLALLRERCAVDGLDIDSDLTPQLRGHINRGTEILYAKVRSITDLVTLIPDSNK
jgi:DNA sulfur modification protein DndE